jgi:hypothetical protein
MRFLDRLRSPVRGVRLLRRLLVELRGIRRALERQADILELGAGVAQRETVQGQVFRSYAHTRDALDEKDLKSLTSVSYVEPEVLGAMLAKEEELRAILGRDPSDEEINAAYQGLEP